MGTDLNKISYQNRIEVLNMNIGNINKGYVELCKVCKGCAPSNKDIIQGGIQI